MSIIRFLFLTIIFLIGYIFLTAIVSNGFSGIFENNGICLGIFQSKIECEAVYRHNRDVELCIHKSWEKCDALIKNKDSSEYDECLNHVRGSCLVGIGKEYNDHWIGLDGE